MKKIKATDLKVGDVIRIADLEDLELFGARAEFDEVTSVTIGNGIVRFETESGADGYFDESSDVETE